MSILIDKSTRLIVQGITGRDGLFHAKKMNEYGTNVVGGTSPGKGGTEVDGIPVFNTMYEAVEQTQANTSIIFVPARFAADLQSVPFGHSGIHPYFFKVGPIGLEPMTLCL